MDYIFRLWSRRRCLRGGSTTGRTPRRSTCQVTGRKQGGRQPCFCPPIRCGVIGLEKNGLKLGKGFCKTYFVKTQGGSSKQGGGSPFHGSPNRSPTRTNKVVFQDPQIANAREPVGSFHITSSLIHKA